MLRNALLALSLTASTTLAASYSTYHRFIPSTSSSDSLPQFQPHGRVEYTSAHDGQLTMETKQDSLIDQEDGWYQYALAVDDRMLTTFTKACMAKSAQKVVLVIHLDSSLPDAKPTSIELNYAGSDGSCPHNWQSGQDLLYVIPPKLELRIPDRIQSVPISFAPPPTVDAATGKPAEPVVEKSFLQKYWMPLLGLGLFFLTQMAPEPPAQAGKAPAK